MKRPASNVPGIPFDFDWIPLALEPDLWDLEKPVSRRRMKLFSLYALSTAVFVAILFLVCILGIGFLNSLNAKMMWPSLLTIFGGMGFVFGIFSGLATLYDFNKFKRQYEQEKHQSTKVDESS